MAKASEQFDSAIDNLKKVAEGDDEEANKAKRLLKALEEDDEEKVDEDEDEEEAAAKRALPLALKRIESLEARIAERDEKELLAMVESDIAAGKIATVDRAEYTELARTNPRLYARLVKNARAVPAGARVDPREQRRAAIENDGRIAADQLGEVDRLLVESLRAAGVQEKRIKATLARRGAEV